MEKTVEIIKNRTFHLHKELESIPVLKKLALAEVTKEEYKDILKKFYGIIAPIEKSIDEGIYAQKNKRVESIKEDLQALGIKNLDEVEIAKTVPKKLSLEEQYGFMYVLEGSRNGGIYLRRALLEKYDNLPLNYFYGKGTDTPEHWRSVLETINQADINEDCLVKGVSDCYEILIDWFRR